MARSWTANEGRGCATVLVCLALVFPTQGCDEDNGEGDAAFAGDGALPDEEVVEPPADLAVPEAATIPLPATSAVLTHHNDNRRAGTQLREHVLSPTAVLTHGMRLEYTRPVDGIIHAQVLYVPALDVAGTPRDVFFTATLKNSVYAFDAADTSASGTEQGLLWKTTLTDPESSTRIYPRGIQSTPVVDLDAGELYLLYQTTDTLDEPFGESSVDVAFWLAALDLRTGALKRRVALAAQVPRDDGSVLSFLPRNHRNRPALLLADGVLYSAFGARSKEGQIEYHGWVLGTDAASFTPRGVFCVTPNSRELGNGGGIWQAGAGLGGDELGHVYLITGNGNRDPAQRWYGNSFLQLGAQGGALALLASFAPYDPLNHLQLNDVDLGSSGPVLIPGTRRLVGGGKTGILYLLDADTMAEVQEFQAFTNIYDPSFVVDSDWEGGPHIHGPPVAWQGPDPNIVHLYAWSENDYLKAYRYDRSQDRILSASPMVGAVLSPADLMPGGMLSLSADGSQAGSAVLWAALVQAGPPYGRLFAFDAESLALLWQTPFSSTPKWMPPTVADGRVFMPTASKQVEVYGLGP